MTILRRLDCVLAPTKDAVHQEGGVLITPSRAGRGAGGAVRR